MCDVLGELDEFLAWAPSGEPSGEPSRAGLCSRSRGLLPATPPAVGRELLFPGVLGVAAGAGAGAGPGVAGAGEHALGRGEPRELMRSSLWKLDHHTRLC